MTSSISLCSKIACAYSSTSEQEKSYITSIKILGSSQKLGPICLAKVLIIFSNSSLLGNLGKPLYIYSKDFKRPVSYQKRLWFELNHVFLEKVACCKQEGRH